MASRPTSLLRDVAGWWRTSLVDPRRAAFFFAFFLGFLPLTGGSLATGWFFLGVVHVGLLWLAGRIVWVWPPATAIACWLSLGYFATTLIAPLLFEGRATGLMDAGSNLQFVALVPLVGALIQARGVDVWSLFLNGVRVSVVAAGLLAGIQVFALHIPRATAGMINPILAGDVAILGGALALVGFGRLSPPMKVFAITAALFGTATAMLTQTRGALLALPLFAIVAGVGLWPDIRRRPWQSAFLSTVLVALLCGFAAMVKIPQRVDRFLNSVETREAMLTRDASTADRVILWANGLEAFADSPLVGYGPQNAVAEVRRRAAEAGMPVPGHTHLHNEFLNTAVARGLLGLAALLLLLAAPVITAVSSPRDARFGERVEFAVLLSGGYAIFGLTNLIFGHDQMATFFAASFLILTVANWQAAAGLTQFSRPDLLSPFRAA